LAASSLQTFQLHCTQVCTTLCTQVGTTLPHLNTSTLGWPNCRCQAGTFSGNFEAVAPEKEHEVKQKTAWHHPRSGLLFGECHKVPGHKLFHETAHPCHCLFGELLLFLVAHKDACPQSCQTLWPSLWATAECFQHPRSALRLFFLFAVLCWASGFFWLPAPHEDFFSTPQGITVVQMACSVHSNGTTLCAQVGTALPCLDTSMLGWPNHHCQAETFS